MLELTFITSSKEKIAHARHLCRDFPVIISKKKNYGIAYVEPRINDRQELIKRSVEDAIFRFNKHVSNPDDKFFFIEDTSVIIPSLSHEKEYPGVDVKYWMQETTFNSLDSQLKKAGNDRNVTVRSDVILVLNKSLKEKFKTHYIVFTSSKNGKIVDREYKIHTQPLYPWLNDTTFNKWFIPDGCSKPMSKLGISIADKHDFRAQAFNEMFQFLKSNGYLKTELNYKQLELFEPVAFVICGPSCAGKTTLSSYLQSKYNYYHLEASDFMYLSYRERHGLRSNVSIGDFAESALKDNPSIVVDQILKHIKKFKHIPLVVTGFRSPLEVRAFKANYGGGLNVEVVYINADAVIRFDRNIIRDRNDVSKSFELFQSKDSQQFKMGLLEIQKTFYDGSIDNEKNLSEFYEEFEKKYLNQLQGGLINNNKIPSSLKRRNLETIIIQTLFNNTNKAYTTTEVSHLIRKTFGQFSKNKNNISRYFNQNFHPYYEISLTDDNKAEYSLSQTGFSYGKWISQQISNNKQG